MDATEQPASFGERLRRYREAAGLTQEDLATRAGLTANAVAALERGRRRRPYPDTVRRLATALALSDDERQALLAAIPPRGGTAPASAPSPAERPSGLPEPFDALIGRERENAAVADLLRDSDVRLLTLTGPAGVGKTRLSLAVAGVVADAFPDGVTFVSLAPVSDARLVLPAIGQALGVPETGAAPRDALVAWLADRRPLLVLDNLEHLMPAAPAVADLLRACPRVTVLATSREALRVRGEQEYAVPPLAVPRTAGAEDPLRAAAVQLFVARARAADLGFALSPEDGQAVAEICRRLDGLPLAIELAAARTPLLPPRALLSRLSEAPALHLLTGGARDLPERQQTLRRTLEWSYDLLEPAEQSAFRRLAVFPGGATIEAATAVLAGPEPAAETPAAEPTPAGHPATEATLGLVASLVTKNLVRREGAATAEPRLRMLETVRELGAELLASHEEEETVRGLAIAYFLALAERAEPELTGPQQQEWLHRLEAEHDNLRAVLAWTVDTGEVEQGLRLATALSLFWHIRGYPREGRAWLERAAAPASGRPALAALRARALMGVARLTTHLGDFVAAAAAGEEALAVARQVGDRRQIARALNRLAALATQRGDNARGAALNEEALRHYQATGDEVGIAGAFADIGQAAFNLGDLDRATALLTEGVDRLRALGHQGGVAVALGNLGRIALRRGHLDRAAALHHEAIALNRQLGYKRGLAIELDRLAKVARYRRHLPQARTLMAESLALWRELGDPTDLALWLQDFAALEAVAGNDETAARWLGAATARRPDAADRAAWSQAGGEETEATVRAAVDALGEAGFAASLAAGRALTIEQAIAAIDLPPGDCAVG